jgi:hypothetical protein
MWQIMVAATGIFLEGKLALQGCTRSRRMRSCEVGTSATIVTGEGAGFCLHAMPERRGEEHERARG